MGGPGRFEGPFLLPAGKLRPLGRAQTVALLLRLLPIASAAFLPAAGRR
jgi:hypothetical protein